MGIREDVIKIAEIAKKASRKLANIESAVKNDALVKMAEAIDRNTGEIQKKNKTDLEAAEKAGLSKALIDRLGLSEKRIKSMADGLREVARMKDPIGEIIGEVLLKNGLLIKKVRVPMGVIGIVYESRPDVTCDSAGLCLKAGNAVVLRGGSEAINSNMIIVRIIEEAALKEGIPEGAIGLVSTTDREAVKVMVKLDQCIDMIILRGSEKMIGDISQGATVPIMRHGKGLCHIYVDEYADVMKSENICFNAKVQRPGVCNAMETLLVHKSIAEKFLPGMINKFKTAGVEIRGDEKTREIVNDLKQAVDEDWSTEYLALILSVKIVDGFYEAIEHITKYGSGHSDAIVTENKDRAEEFLAMIDSAAVYWNASTRFTDGGQFGMGAEIGISTQKSHARGPMGIKELTSIKYKIYGNGQVRE